MTSTWSVCFILFIAVLGARAFVLEDDPLVEKVKAIVANLDNYVSSQGYDEVNLPDIGSKPPLELRNGEVGVLSSAYVQSVTAINETKLDDGSTLYTFDIRVGLSELVIHYDFEFSALIVKEKGNFSLSVLTNIAEVYATAVVQSNSTCEAEVTKAAVLALADFKLTITPGNIPHVISEAILDVISKLLLPSLNKLVQSAIQTPDVQDVFSSIACQELA